MRKPPKKSLYPGSRSLIVVMPSRAVPSRVCSSCPHTNPIIWASGTHTTPPRTDGRTGEIDVGQVGGSQVGEEAEACNRNFVSLIRRVLCAQTAPAPCQSFVPVLSIAAQMIYRSLIFINVSGESRPPRPPRPRVHLHATHTHTLSGILNTIKQNKNSHRSTSAGTPYKTTTDKHIRTSQRVHLRARISPRFARPLDRISLCADADAGWTTQNSHIHSRAHTRAQCSLAFMRTE